MYSDQLQPLAVLQSTFFGLADGLRDVPGGVHYLVISHGELHVAYTFPVFESLSEFSPLLWGELSVHSRALRQIEVILSSSNNKITVFG